MVPTYGCEQQNGLVLPKLKYVCMSELLKSSHRDLLQRCHDILQYLCVFLCVSMPLCVLIAQGVKQGRVGALGYICGCISVNVGGKQIGATVDLLLSPVTARVLFVSCGPLLTQTALLWEGSCCNSPIYTCTHTHTHNRLNTGLLWPFPWVLSNQATAGATWSSQNEKVAIFDISIKMFCQEESVVVMGMFLVVTRQAGLTVLFFKCAYPSMCLPLFLALTVVNTAGTVK